MAKSVREINEKIKKGKAVVVTKEELLSVIEKKGIKKTAAEVDVVTTATFGPMCSSMALFNIGHPRPKIKIQKAWMNDVACCAGLAAVDLILGVTELRKNDPANLNYPGEFRYGGAHVIEDLLAGKDVRLKASAHGTDCYPRRELETMIRLRDMNEAMLINPRNAYQNYNVAVNKSDRVVYTYMGMLRPKLANAYYCSAGQLSPLLNDPLFRTIGIGTRLFFGGGIGYVFSQGTQHTTDVKRNKKGTPCVPAGTLALSGDLKQMSTDWIRAASVRGYGVSLAIGIGVPIPLLDEAVLESVSVTDAEIRAPVIDYGKEYGEGRSEPLGSVSYAELKSGTITVAGKTIPTAGLSSYYEARHICEILRDRINQKKFFLTEPVAPLPSKGVNFHNLEIRKK